MFSVSDSCTYAWSGDPSEEKEEEEAEEEEDEEAEEEEVTPAR